MNRFRFDEIRYCSSFNGNTVQQFNKVVGNDCVSKFTTLQLCLTAAKTAGQPELKRAKVILSVREFVSILIRGSFAKTFTRTGATRVKTTI